MIWSYINRKYTVAIYFFNIFNEILNIQSSYLQYFQCWLISHWMAWIPQRKTHLCLRPCLQMMSHCQLKDKDEDSHTHLANVFVCVFLCACVCVIWLVEEINLCWAIWLVENFRLFRAIEKGCFYTLKIKANPTSLTNVTLMLLPVHLRL